MSYKLKLKDLKYFSLHVMNLENMREFLFLNLITTFKKKVFMIPLINLLLHSFKNMLHPNVMITFLQKCNRGSLVA